VHYILWGCQLADRLRVVENWRQAAPIQPPAERRPPEVQDRCGGFVRRGRSDRNERQEGHQNGTPHPRPHACYFAGAFYLTAPSASGDSAGTGHAVAGIH
jgi:hypothetical protein